MPTRLKVMRNTEAPVLTEQPYDAIEYGFMRDHAGRIFFLQQHGRWTFPFPILEDGRISKQGSTIAIESPGTIVTLIHPKELGITELRWADEEADLYAE